MKSSGWPPIFKSLCPLELTQIGARNGHNEEKLVPRDDKEGEAIGSPFGCLLYLSY